MASKTQSPYSRRDVLGAGATMAAASMTPASAATGRDGQAAEVLADPAGKYPKPPFKRQSQPWPGLASQMDPPPDHGEHSYRGAGRLAERKALITGGDAGMGRAAAIAFAREGADVAINYFLTEEPDAQQVIALIRAEERKGLALPGDIRDLTFCQDLLRKAIEGLGGLDIVVSNAGRQQARQSILDVSSEAFDATMKTNIYAPFWIIKTALPHLKPGSVIIGTTSEQAYDPSPDLYDYAQTKAATMNYVKSLAKQLGTKGIRVNGVAPGPIWATAARCPRLIRLHRFGGKEVLWTEELDISQPDAGELLISVRAASVNPVDFNIRSGNYPAVKDDRLPYTLGRDISGSSRNAAAKRAASRSAMKCSASSAFMAEVTRSMPW